MNFKGFQFLSLFFFSLQVEESAVNLWNWTVAKKTAPGITDMQRVKCQFEFAAINHSKKYLIN